MPLPPRTMSIHDAPQPGESAIDPRLLRHQTGAARDPQPDFIQLAIGGVPIGRPIRVRRGPTDVTPRSIDLAEPDAREQQAIADAVEGVIP